jgi:hypothetical protein
VEAPQEAHPLCGGEEEAGSMTGIHLNGDAWIVLAILVAISVGLILRLWPK